MAGLVTAATDVAAGPEAVPNTFHVDRARVQVRVYDTAVMPAADQTVALRAATGVLAAAGIDMTWLACGSGESATNPAACGAPLAHDELAVRLVRLAGTPSAHGELSLGYSLVDMPEARGTLATIYVDRVEWVATQAGCDGATVRGRSVATVGGCTVATVLGHAVAHEAGHLLLGTHAHGAAGLMRAVWSRSELQRNDPADWLFTPGESAAMRRALQQRERQAQMATNIIWGR
jgi:hypothetical protein